MNELPDFFDPRCRPWYAQTYKQNTTIFSNPYKFISGDQGMTTCIPLWAKQEEADKQF